LEPASDPDPGTNVMNDSHRIALYLRVIAGEIAAAKGALEEDAKDETAEILDTVSVKLRELADTVEAADA
jgi:hypothetical protein